MISQPVPPETLAPITSLVRAALAEDIGSEDVTTRCIVPPHLVLTGKFVAKESGVVAGLAVAHLTFSLLDTQVRFEPYLTDGEPVQAGQIIAVVEGPAPALLSGERVALNFMQRMSGIATLSRRFVEAVAGTKAVILDTRKTAPGLRVLDKWAVRLGGAANHRAGLYDMVLIKENHITAAGTITEAVSRVRAGDRQRRPVEVEVKNLAELSEALGLRVDRILLDNMSLTTIKEAVQIANGQIPLEASGNVSLETVAQIAATGVDFISVGALTHSVKALDLSLLLEAA
ncbi:MAG TPA: carboxylating nicotinate-nucleotide diphosphorylase [Anaerolineae bacterium]|nr:carboxylating nicotinate-nucleotide diphosphorylase [Anaerolineae bacterium]HMR63164.1 carboxylating nicotinate-nucleotide diphosphorylase [Anaerolineae bacterium]